MKVLLLELEKKSFTSGFLQSLMPAILAAWAKRAGWDAVVRFLPFERVDYDEPCDVVAISSYTSRAPQSYEVARRFRERGKLVVLGGPHTKGCIDDVRLHVDAVFRDCDEEAWRGFLAGVERGDVRPSHPGVFVPSRKLLDPPPYHEYRPFLGSSRFPILLASVGCPYTCGFCTDWDSDFKKRDVEDVLRDVAEVGDRLFFFADPNFGANPVSTRELLRRMIPLRKRYFVNYSFSFLEDEMLELLRDSGCMFVGIGLDSLSTHYPKNAMQDGASILEDAIRKVDRIKRYIPFVHVNLILGLDTDTEATFDAALEFHRRSAADIVMPHIATPFPGTPLYDQLKAEGRIFDWDERHYDTQHLVTTLKNMSPERFYDRYVELQRELRSPWTAYRKAFRQLRESGSLMRAALLLGILGKKSLSMWHHELAELERSKERLLASGAYDRAAAGRPTAPARLTALGYAGAPQGT